jgi:Uma2 family endonuclease
LRYPDIVIDRARGAGGDFTATGPALLAEVLSPSTERIDLGDKAAEYLRLPSLQAYVVLAQDEPKAWVWVRAEGRFPAAAEVIVGLDKIISLKALSLMLPLGALYAGTDIDRG